MLVDLFKHMRFAPIESYQYIGFGSVAFIDFRLVHKALGIKELVSIEATSDPDEQTRFRHNIPYAGLNLHFGKSNAVLPTLDLSRRSLIWLDYDDSLDRSMANDLATVGRRAQSGTFVAVTFAAAFPVAEADREKALRKLKEHFPDFIAEDAKANQFDGAKFAEFGRSTLGALLQRSVSNADAGEEDTSKKRSVRQICFFKYRDGVPMVTVGWIVVAQAESQVFDACHFDSLPFVRTQSEAFRITIPLVTPMEVREMERRMPDLANAQDLNWIPQKERSEFGSVYRYLPYFGAVDSHI